MLSVNFAAFLILGTDSRCIHTAYPHAQADLVFVLEAIRPLVSIELHFYATV